MWPLFRSNLDMLGNKLEGSLNQMALGHDVIVEDADLMVEQMAEIGR